MAEITKPFLNSKTIIIALLQILVGIIVFIQGQVEIGGAITVKGVIDIIVRLSTKEAVNVLSPKE